MIVSVYNRGCEQVNIYEIAKRAGVSIATVSRVLNNNVNVRSETREKVISVLKESDYTPNAIARSLAVNRTETIGVLASDIRDSYYANAIYTIEQGFRDYGYNVILCNTGGQIEEKKKYINVLLQQKVDGIIFVGSVFREKYGNQHILDAAAKVPVVMLNSYIKSKNIYSIVCDDEYATISIIKELYKKGHTEFAYLYDVKSFSGISKLKGFVAGLKNVGISFDPNSVIQVSQGLNGGMEGIDILEKRGIKYTAVVTSEDDICVGAVKRLQSMKKRIPDDVAVFGFDNTILAKCTTPELSSVDNKVHTMGITAVQVMKNRLDGNDVPVKTIIKPELIIRESC